MFSLRLPLISRIATAFSSASKVRIAPAFSPACFSNKSINTTVSRFTSSLVSPQLDTSILQKVNQQIESSSEGRLFVVVQLCGKQFKITSGDIIIVEGYWPPNNGEIIRLDKVLLVGSKDFSLIGRPLVPQGLVDVQGTIIEKSLSHTRTHFKKKRRKQYMRINFYRTQQTMIRINSIELNSHGIPEKDEFPDEFENRFF
ncbi:large ribosomal subunit protein bL21m [Malaya genurostris]|uniref:large ribosomal subunit protein bL21m n=1 Tax=Malaya genurostris TaxID=325434 RepID=UPI0026F3F3AC|nr:large ribosomal subunit protein bL21m [Malaya genurostris]